MPVPISNVTRRVVYAASGTGPYNFSFEILANTDVAVYKDDLLLTLTTNYTVTINPNGTGYVTLTATPTGATQIAIVGNRTIQRATDFVTGGDFFANALNDELDQQTIFNQQNSEGLARSLQAPQTDPTSINMVLPRSTVRAGKTLAFDSSGNPTTGETVGDNRGDWTTATAYVKRDIVKDTTNGNIYYANTAHTSVGTLPISTNADVTKWDLLVDNTAAYLYLGAKASDPTLDNYGQPLVVGALYYNTVSNQTKVYDGAWNATTQPADGSVTQAKMNATYEATLVKKTSSTGSVVVTSGTTAQRDGSPLAGYIRFNTSLTRFEGYNGSVWSTVGGGATGGGDDQVFIENSKTVTTNYTITTNKNAMTTGPITINSGITVTVPSGSRWVVI